MRRADGCVRGRRAASAGRAAVGALSGSERGGRCVRRPSGCASIVAGAPELGVSPTWGSRWRAARCSSIGRWCWAATREELLGWSEALADGRTRGGRGRGCRRLRLVRAGVPVHRPGCSAGGYGPRAVRGVPGVQGRAWTRCARSWTAHLGCSLREVVFAGEELVDAEASAWIGRDAVTQAGAVRARGGAVQAGRELGRASRLPGRPFDRRAGGGARGGRVLAGGCVRAGRGARAADGRAARGRRDGRRSQASEEEVARDARGLRGPGGAGGGQRSRRGGGLRR